MSTPRHWAGQWGGQSAVRCCRRPLRPPHPGAASQSGGQAAAGSSAAGGEEEGGVLGGGRVPETHPAAPAAGRLTGSGTVDRLNVLLQAGYPGHAAVQHCCHCQRYQTSGTMPKPVKYPSRRTCPSPGPSAAAPHAHATSAMTANRAARCAAAMPRDRPRICLPPQCTRRRRAISSRGVCAQVDLWMLLLPSANTGLGTPRAQPFNSVMRMGAVNEPRGSWAALRATGHLLVERGTRCSALR